MANKLLTKNEEFDIYKLFYVFTKRKYFILGFVLVATLFTTLWSVFSKPVYRGEVLIEVGEMAFNTVTAEDNVRRISLQPVENKDDLQEMILQLANSVQPSSVQVKAAPPRGNTRLIRIIADSTDKVQIEARLNYVIKIVLDRFKSRQESLKKTEIIFKPSAIIGEISISDENYRKVQTSIIIGTFLSSIILSLVMVFIIEYVQLIRLKVFEKI